jgi:hypothetical protein
MKREQLFQKIITQVAQGHEDEYISFAKEIESREETQLEDKYQSIIDKLKNNPMEEKELASLIESAKEGEISHFEIASVLMGDNFLNETDNETIALLISKAIKKVMDFTDENGVVKKVASFENYEPMKPVDRMKFETLSIKFQKSKDEEKEVLEKQIDDFLTEKTKTNVAGLSVWERGLFQEMLIKEAKSISNIFLGKK